MSALRKQKARRARELEPEVVEAAIVRKAVKESIALREARGEIFSKPRDKDQPFQCIDGLQRLFDGGHIGRPSYDAGLRYGRDYCHLYEVGRLPSSLERTASGALWQFELVKRYGDALAGARREGLQGNANLIDVCNVVCARGVHLVPRSVLAGRLVVALERLSDYYAKGWSPQGNDFEGLTKTEWFTIAETVNPSLTWEEFDGFWHESGMGDGAEARANRRALQAWAVDIYGPDNYWGVGGSGKKPPPVRLEVRR